MHSPVQLYLRARLEDGTFPDLKAALLPNGHVRPGYAISAGRAVKVTSGSYHLRYTQHGKRVWDPVGTEASLTEVALLRKRRKCEDAVRPVYTELTGHTDVNKVEAGISMASKSTRSRRRTSTPMQRSSARPQPMPLCF